MSGRNSIVLGAIVAAVLFAALAGGYKVGTNATAQNFRAMDARDQKILDVIVKRNPQASVLDFQNFPARFVSEADALGLDFRYVMALIDAESEWNPGAVSPKCAVGLMQVMPGTARGLPGANTETYMPPVKDMTGKRCYQSLGTLGEPLANVRIGMAYLKQQIDEYGFGPEHLRAYNRGPSLARKHWPADRYAETVALKYVALAQGSLR